MNLPTDIWREVCLYLTNTELLKSDFNFDEVDLKQSFNFLNNENDIFWKLKFQTLTDEACPAGETYKSFYEYYYYEKYIEDREWCCETSRPVKEELDMKRFLDDEVFLLRHANAKDNNESTILIYSYELDFKHVEKLLQAGADPNMQNKYGWTALLLYMYRGEEKPDDIKKIKLLIEYGANVNYQCSMRDQDTVLMAAAECSSPFMLHLLINAGANINFVSSSGWTALLNAVHCCTCELTENEHCTCGRIDNAEFLLKAGANVHHQYAEGKTVFNIAENNVVRKMLEQYC
jgi:hypothetical protein